MIDRGEIFQNIAEILTLQMAPQNQSLSLWFETEVQINEPALRAYLQKKVPEGTDVDDVVQETYLRIIKFKESKPIQSPRGLLFSIAKNVVRDIFRKKYAAKTISLGKLEPGNVLFQKNPNVAELTPADEIEMLQEAIRSLPNKCRKIFILHNYERQSYKEIAAKFNVSVKTVEAQMTIGMKKCRQFFQSKGLLYDD